MNDVVSVIDYGVGNLFSVQKALEHCGATVRLVSSPEDLKHATKVLLPGVGAFADAMRQLNASGMDEAIKAYVASGAPLFGICLGMQLLLDSSHEFGHSEGLGLIPGTVELITARGLSGQPIKVPHIGWSSLVMPPTRSSWEGTVLETVETRNSAVYFVHSYMAVPSVAEHRVADCQYGDTAVAAVVARDNVCGAQFHPEKSGRVGLSMLRSFVTAR